MKQIFMNIYRKKHGKIQTLIEESKGKSVSITMLLTFFINTTTKREKK